MNTNGPLLLAVFPDKRIIGVGAEESKQRLERMAISGVGGLSDVYPTDAHCVTYRIQDDFGGFATTWRVNKAGLPFMRSIGMDIVTHAIFLDVDDTRRPFDLVAQTFPEAGWYETRGGYRIVFRLAEPVQPEYAEAGIRWLVERAKAVGITPDPACVDWTRLFRMPHVMRDGTPYRSPVVVHPRGILRLPEGLKVYANPDQRVTVGSQHVAWETEIPEEMHYVATRIAQIVPETDRHRWHLKLAATLCDLGVRPEIVPSICLEVARRAGYANPADRARASRYAVERFVAGDSIAGLSGDSYHKVFEIVRPLGGNQLRRETPKMSLPEAEKFYLKVLREVGDETVVIHTPCGFGKTHGACIHAQNVTCRVGITTPTIRNTEELQHKIGATNCARFFSPVQHPDCIYHDKLKNFSGNGLSFRKTFCWGKNGAGKCPSFDECEVKSGVEGDPESRILIGTHAAFGRVEEKAEYLFVDEPPRPCEIVQVTPEHLRDLKSRSRFFEDELLYPISKVADRILADDRVVEFTLDYPECDEVPSSLLDIWGRPHEQPIRPEIVKILRAKGASDDFVQALKTLNLLWKQPKAKWLRDGDGWSVLIPKPEHEILLQRTAPTVLLDATPAVTLAMRGDAPARLVTIDVRDRVQPAREVAFCDGRHQWVRDNLEGIVIAAAEWARKRVFDGPVGVYCHLDIEKRLKANPELLAKFGRDVKLGHYRALRGLNAWNDCGAYVTIGDPRMYWPSIQREAAHVGCDAFTLLQQDAVGELEQAHGRARTIRRVSKSHHLHVGKLTPARWVGLCERSKLDL